jgi:uncharacterized Zn ribbon protein
MRICPSCNESYTYFNSYFGIDMCTSCGWSEDIESNEDASVPDLSGNFFKEREIIDSLKEKKPLSQAEEISESSMSK